MGCRGALRQKSPVGVSGSLSMSVSQNRPLGGAAVRFSKPDPWAGSSVRFKISPVGGVLQCPMVARPLNCGSSSVTPEPHGARRLRSRWGGQLPVWRLSRWALWSDGGCCTGTRRPVGFVPAGSDGVCGWLADGKHYSQDIWGQARVDSRPRA